MINRKKTERHLRFLGCAALLALLAASGYAGAQHAPLQTVGVPVMVQMVSSGELASASLGDTAARLAAQREETLETLQRVAGDPRSSSDTADDALARMAALSAQMEKEAALCALLDQMGFGETAVILGEACVHVIAPWQTAENEHNRVRIIDAAASQTGFSADAVKIILAKK